jgi:DNA gyrase/topoisomerase IV subunit B
MRRATVIQMPRNAAEVINDYWDAKEEYEAAKKKLERVRQVYLQRFNPGKYKDCTIYEVSETRVRAFTRSGYRAVRWKRRDQ